MDINCADNCFYQLDGKCTLHELSYIPSYSGGNVSDCPYMQTFPV
ncbi:hypothetical protein AGMMS49975_13190 [Clostridia bacterium]|nr:hypothetical protein AGMMS49975_13190 [Clostridia bacterium]